MTSAHSRQPKEIGQSTSSAAVSPAKTSASQAKALGSPVQGPVFGSRCTGSLARYDRDSCSWKTSQRCLDGGWQPYSATFPRSGMTRNGTLFLLPPLVHRTGEKGFGLWPTPTADACVGSAPTPEMAERFRSKGQSGSFVEAMAARMWPTPRTQMTRKVVVRDGGHRCNLEEVVAEVQRVTTGGHLNPTWVEWLMGFPLGWTDLEDSATQSSPKSSS